MDAQVRADQDSEISRTDVELVAAINRGDAAAFDVLYFRHRDWVAALAYRFTGDSDASLSSATSSSMRAAQCRSWQRWASSVW